jgi:hypothetical protein
MLRKDCILIALILVCIVLGGLIVTMSGQQSALDLSTPEIAFLSVQCALNTADAEMIEQVVCDILETGWKKEDKRKFAERLAKELQELQELGGEYPYFNLIKQGRVVHVETIDRLAWGRYPGVIEWIRWTEGKKRGYAGFLKQDGEWKWFPCGGDVSPPVFDDYDFSIPINAFLSIKRAENPPGWESGVSDTMGIYEGISSDVKVGVSFEGYEKVVKERKDNIKWERPNLGYDVDHLEIEMLEPEAGVQKCKVWKLDKDKKRGGFELFIKEIVLGGEEWKWIPDSKCIWYPGGK